MVTVKIPNERMEQVRRPVLTFAGAGRKFPLLISTLALFRDQSSEEIIRRQRNQKRQTNARERE
jgi:23S rRNA maturation mini-RNase III